MLRKLRTVHNLKYSKQMQKSLGIKRDKVRDSWECRSPPPLPLSRQNERSSGVTVSIGWQSMNPFTFSLSTQQFFPLLHFCYFLISRGIPCQLCPENKIQIKCQIYTYADFVSSAIRFAIGEGRPLSKSGTLSCEIRIFQKPCEIWKTLEKYRKSRQMLNSKRSEKSNDLRKSQES